VAIQAGQGQAKRPFWQMLYVQVIAAIVVGAVLGAVAPGLGAKMKPLGDGFIALIKMMIAPVVFCTVVHGVASMRDMARLGRIGLKAIVYFEVVSTFALALGMLAAHLIHPGVGFGIDPATLSNEAVAGYVKRAEGEGIVPHLMAIIPTTFFDAFAKGDLLQVLLVAILFGVAVARLGETGEKINAGVELLSKVFFRIIGMIVHLAPIGAFGAMAFTVGQYGVDSLIKLGQLVLTFYATSLVFVFGVLGAIAALVGFNIFRFLAYIREELLIVLGTSSSEPALPGMLKKLKNLGASDPVVGLVIPTGYSFNLDGTNIYMTLAALFLAQATGTHLTLGQELGLLGIAMLTSKGASGVTGAGFVTLAATLAIVPAIPIEALGVLLGIDRFMSECRSLTNLCGNGVATLVVAKWEGELDMDTLERELTEGSPSGQELETQEG
jgi:aerobic C4-dicarboxylate transport protein